VIEGVRSLRALGNAREAFLRSARAAESVESVTRVQSGLDARVYESGPMIELFLDVAVTSEDAVVAWLDVVLADDETTIRPSLRLLRSDGETVHEFADRFATTEAEFALELSGACRQLLHAFGKVNLDEPESSFDKL
jgi:hypothetical protein